MDVWIRLKPSLDVQWRSCAVWILIDAIYICICLQIDIFRLMFRLSWKDKNFYIGIPKQLFNEKRVFDSSTCWKFNVNKDLWFLHIKRSNLRKQRVIYAMITQPLAFPWIIIDTQRDVDCLPALLHVECIEKLPLLTPCLQDPSTGPVVLNKDGNVAIKIQAKPGAKCNNVTGNTKYHLINFLFIIKKRL